MYLPKNGEPSSRAPEPWDALRLDRGGWYAVLSIVAGSIFPDHTVSRSSLGFITENLGLSPDVTGAIVEESFR